MRPCDHDSRPLYEKLIGPLRERARGLGYAIGVHGSLRGDIDLIACPWTADAASARELAEALGDVVLAVHGEASWSWRPGRDPEFTREGGPGVMPHGRLGWVINLGGGPYIDLSVMPRRPEPECEARADGGGSEPRWT